MKLSMMVSLICFVTSIPLIALGRFFKKKNSGCSQLAQAKVVDYINTGGKVAPIVEYKIATGETVRSRSTVFVNKIGRAHV